MAEDERGDSPQEPEAERPAEEQGDALPGEPGEAASPPEDAPEGAAEAPDSPDSPDEAPDSPEAPQGGGARPRPGQRSRPRDEDGGGQEEVIPGADLEPDLVLEEEQGDSEDPALAQYAEAEAPEAEVQRQDEPEPAPEEHPEPEPVAREPLDLAADARYRATGKRKSAVARVILRPGDGTYQINGRHLDEFFPRIKLQRMARQPLEAAGYGARMDVVARIHGGGVAAQAGALRHGVARALVEADPNLRAELKRRGYLTRDPRVKERKKAGLKKARKRPQFSKR